MNSWGLLFRDEMMRALLRAVDPKTQTRRLVTRFNSLVNGKRASRELWEHVQPARAAWFEWREDYPPCLLVRPIGGSAKYEITPQYCVGDEVWSREVFRDLRNADGSGRVLYRADGDECCSGWQSSLYLPKELTRYRGRIAKVRLCRVAEITEEDALAEGVRRFTLEEMRFKLDAGDVVAHARNGCLWHSVHSIEEQAELGAEALPMRPSAVAAFRDLWEHVHGRDAWSRNDFVWALTLERRA